MATGNLILSVVDVGQGQCTFVEIYNSSNSKLVETLLFDCGSDHRSYHIPVNLQYIADKVSTMSSPEFSCVFLSHSDSDHISLLLKLLSKFTTKPKIREVWYGGDYNNYTFNNHGVSTNVLDYLVSNGYCNKTALNSPFDDYSGYDGSSFSEHFWASSFGGAKVFAVVANVKTGKINDPGPPPKKKPKLQSAEGKNRVSLVCSLVYHDFSYVICGDATNKTMAATSKVFSGGTNVFDSNVMTTLPHHGSRTTAGLSVASSSALANNRAIIKSFASITNAEFITVSAYLRHNHPSLELMNLFPPRMSTPLLKDPRLKDANSHMIQANVDITLTLPVGVSVYSHDQYFSSKTNTFTTNYSNPFSSSPGFQYQLSETNLSVTKTKGYVSGKSINSSACWVFSIEPSSSSGNSYFLGGVEKLGASYFTTGVSSSVALTRAPLNHQTLTKPMVEVQEEQRKSDAIPLAHHKKPPRYFPKPSIHPTMRVFAI